MKDRVTSETVYDQYGDPLIIPFVWVSNKDLRGDLIRRRDTPFRPQPPTPGYTFDDINKLIWEPDIALTTVDGAKAPFRSGIRGGENRAAALERIRLAHLHTAPRKHRRSHRFRHHGNRVLRRRSGATQRSDELLWISPELSIVREQGLDWRRAHLRIPRWRLRDVLARQLLRTELPDHAALPVPGIEWSVPRRLVVRRGPGPDAASRRARQQKVPAARKCRSEVGETVHHTLDEMDRHRRPVQCDCIECNCGAESDDQRPGEHRSDFDLRRTTDEGSIHSHFSLDSGWSSRMPVCIDTRRYGATPLSIPFPPR